MQRISPQERVYSKTIEMDVVQIKRNTGSSNKAQKISGKKFWATVKIVFKMGRNVF